MSILTESPEANRGSVAALSARMDATNFKLETHSTQCRLVTEKVCQVHNLAVDNRNAIRDQADLAQDFKEHKKKHKRKMAHMGESMLGRLNCTNELVSKLVSELDECKTLIQEQSVEFEALKDATASPRIIVEHPGHPNSPWQVAIKQEEQEDATDSV